MSFIQVDQEFVVDTDTIVNNSGDNIADKEQARIPFFYQITTIDHIDKENDSAGEDYFPPLKRFQTSSWLLQYGVSRRICFLIF